MNPAFYRQKSVSASKRGSATLHKALFRLWTFWPKLSSGWTCTSVYGLDGYTADSKDGVDWLKGQGDDKENIDTYYQVITELSPKEWWYNDFTTFVITHNKHTFSEVSRWVFNWMLSHNCNTNIFSVGIRLIENAKHKIKLRLLNMQTYNGTTGLIYTWRIILL